jgi:hypothetical protein
MKKRPRIPENARPYHADRQTAERLAVYGAEYFASAPSPGFTWVPSCRAPCRDARARHAADGAPPNSRWRPLLAPAMPFSAGRGLPERRPAGAPPGRRSRGPAQAQVTGLETAAWRKRDAARAAALQASAPEPQQPASERAMRPVSARERGQPQPASAPEP